MPAGLTALAATYIDSTSYSLVNDQTSIHEQYRPVLMVKNDDTVVRGYVVSSSFGGGITTVTISGATVPATVVSGSVGDISIPGNDSSLPKEYLDTQYLNRTNTGVFTPTANYHPATKKYVDDNSGGVSEEELTTTSGDIVAQIPSDYISDSEMTTISGDLQTDINTKMTDLSDDTDPELGGDLDLNEFYVELIPAPASDDTGSGLMSSVTVDTNSNGIGSSLYMAADGHYDDADADAAATMPCTVLALEAGTGTKKVLHYGYMRNDGWNWTPGGLLYVSTTSGTMTQTTVSGSGDQVQVVGYATNADRIFFSPNLSTAEVS